MRLSRARALFEMGRGIDVIRFPQKQRFWLYRRSTMDWMMSRFLQIDGRSLGQKSSKETQEATPARRKEAPRSQGQRSVEEQPEGQRPDPDDGKAGSVPDRITPPEEVAGQTGG